MPISKIGMPLSSLPVIIHQSMEVPHYLAYDTLAAICMLIHDAESVTHFHILNQLFK